MNINKNTWLCSLLLAACAQTSQAQVQVTKTNDQITIGNAYLSRTFRIANGRLTPGELTNKRAGGIVFTPSAGSEEFALIRKSVTTPPSTDKNGQQRLTHGA